ncbi:unnamed protein product [Meloidogyne enterolobii]|uniref:Uncharacterized protein n=1 Tax=Meloidogyne enterolobii TaxID=390850 RepID=A0ACB0Y3B8_MELEN
MEREIIWDCVYAPNCRAKIRTRKWTCCGRYIGGEMRTAIAKHLTQKLGAPRVLTNTWMVKKGKIFL